MNDTVQHYDESGRWDLDGKVLKVEGFDEAIIGLCRKAGHDDCLLYDEDKVINLLMGDGMSYDEAIEYYEYNIAGAFMGDGTPAFFFKATESELDLLETLKINLDGAPCEDNEK